MPGLFQTTIYFDSGSVLRSVPMQQEKAVEFALTFISRDDVVETNTAPVEKTDAQKSLRWIANEWRQFVERNRSNEATFDAGKDKLGATYYLNFQMLGTSG